MDVGTTIGALALPCPVLAASGTAGHGAELAAYGDLAALGAVVVKSLAAEPWTGNPAPRVHGTAGGAAMLNSVGLQGPGVEAWVADELPALQATGARVVVSLWGRSVGDFRKAAELVAAAPDGIAAVEVNLSCPNLDGGRHLFAQSPSDSADVIGEVVDALGGGRPVWAKLTAVTASIVEVAGAAAEAGAAAVTCINTLLGLGIDVERRSYVLGSGPAGGGLSGPAIHPVAVRAVHDVHRALPDLAVIGVGGVVSGVDAVELLLAGASAVQVGTATFADPRACWRVADELRSWCMEHGVASVRELIGAVHGR
ncbi:MAG: dihydroorotate dehydrogenase [Acidimicrobiia bacterium]|nr:dihydroorotate dehydrogenase [Acidimicrobiia bacterium]